MYRVVRWLLPLLLLATAAWGQQYGFVHYQSGSDCDSLCGPNGFYLADKASVVGVGGITNAHLVGMLDRNPNIIWPIYETITDKQDSVITLSTCNTSRTEWWKFLRSRGKDVAFHEKTFMHWADTTIVCYESPYGSCFAIRYWPGMRVPMYVTQKRSWWPVTTDSVQCLTSPTASGNPCYLAWIKVHNWDAIMGAVNCSANPTQMPPTQRYAACWTDSAGGTNDRAQLRQLYKEFICEKLMDNSAVAKIPNDNRWAPALFGDNLPWDWYAWGESVKKGGHVRELGGTGGPAMNYSGSFPDRLRDGPTSGAGRHALTKAISDTFDVGNWTNRPDGALKFFGNIGGDYNPTYNPWPTGSNRDFHGYIAELNMSLVSRTYAQQPMNQYTASANLPMMWTGQGVRCVGSTCQSFGQLQYNTFALYKATHSGDDYWGMQYTTNQCQRCDGPCSLPCTVSGSCLGTMFPSELRWKGKVLGVGALDSCTTSGKGAYLGSSPSEALTSIKTGTSNGLSYVVYRRKWPNGVIVLRAFDDYSQTLDSTTTSVSVTIPTPPTGKAARLVKVDGTLDGLQLTKNATFNLPTAAARIFVWKLYDNSRPCEGDDCEEICESGCKLGGYEPPPAEIKAATIYALYDVRGRRLAKGTWQEVVKTKLPSGNYYLHKLGQDRSTAKLLIIK